MVPRVEKSETEQTREPLIPRIRVTPSERNRLVLVGISALFMYWVFSKSVDALGPFFFALALAYLMSPLVDLFDRAMPRAVAILLVYAIFIGILVGLGWWLSPRIVNQFKQLGDAWPQYQQRFQEWASNATSWYQGLPLSGEARTSLENALKNAAGSLFGIVQQAATNLLSLVTRTTGFVIGLLIIPFWLFYVLKDSERGIGALNSMIPHTWRLDIWHIIRIVNGVLSSYIRGQLVLAAVVGVATTVGMIIVGAPYALILGLVSGMTEVVPVIGPVLGAVPGVLIALFSGDWVLILKVLLVYVAVQQLENNLLVPKIQGDSVKLHPALIMVALVVGSQVGGFVGLIVAVPVAAILRDVYLYLYRRFTEDYTPREAEASVPSRSDENTPAGKAREARELELARQEPGINTEDELIADLDKQAQESETAVGGSR